MPKLTIDGISVDVPNGATVLQAAEMVGIEIPRFCYHERLSIAGNCRMCLVEVKPGPPKPAAACALPVAEGMEVFTNSPMARDARKGTIEFLLLNHPLDCPICDQGGECDLQDETVVYGDAVSRFREAKHAYADKDLGPLVRTNFTRCIHCTRCVRFCEEIAGTPELGMVGRGSHCEIVPYVEGALTSELSGNLVDVCPVGSLTNAPYAFSARPWELTRTESIDVMDAVGSSIRIDTRSNQVLRILPRLNDAVNEEWIGDRSRYAIDGLLYQRLDTPWMRSSRSVPLEPTYWEAAFDLIRTRIAAVGGGARIGAIAGDQTDVETITVMKDLLGALGSPNMDCRQDGAKIDAGTRAGYLFNSTIAGVSEADAILLIGTNPRKEAPVLNSRIFQRWRAGKVTVGRIGCEADLTYPLTDVGSDPAQALQDLASGRHPFSKALKEAERPMIIVGMGALVRQDGAAVLAGARALAETFGMLKDGWNGFNVLHTAAGRVGGLDLGFVPSAGGKTAREMVKAIGADDMDILFLLGADEMDFSALGGRAKTALVVYIGSHGDAGAATADVVLPGCAWTEKDATYVSMEGRVQRSWRAVFAPGEAKEDWRIIRQLAAKLGVRLPLDTLDQVRARAVAINPVLGTLDTPGVASWGAFGVEGRVSAEPFVAAIETYHMTCPISRASPTMAACIRALQPTTKGWTGTNG